MQFLPGLEPEPAADRPDAASDEWYTPKWLLAWLPAIWFDPCWCASSNVDTLSGLDVRNGSDGLAEDWASLFDRPGIVWVNPPYSDCAAWVARCAEQARLLDRVVVALIPAKPGEVYWHTHIWGQAAVGFLRGRVAFDTIAGPGTESGLVGSALIVWGADEKADQVVLHIARAARGHRQAPVWVRKRCD